MCPECKATIKYRYNYVRHLKECKKIAKVYECSECSFVSTRKSNYKTHQIEQHSHAPSREISDISERPLANTTVFEACNGKVVIVGSGVKVASFIKDSDTCSTLKKCGEICVSFEIKSVKVKDEYLLIVGDYQMVLKRIYFIDQSTTFETILDHKTNSKQIISSDISSESVFLLFDHSIEILFIETSEK